MAKKGIISVLSFLLVGAVVLILSSVLLVNAADLLSTPMDPAELSSLSSVGAIGVHSGVIQGDWLEEFNSERSTEILGSGNDNLGIINVNQASGSLNNQVNLRVLALSTDPGSLLEILVLGQVEDLSDSHIRSVGSSSLDLIQNSFHGNAGILGINQASGNLNIQSNSLVLVIGGTASLTDMELSKIGTANNSLVQEEPRGRADIIKDSFDNINAIVQVNQSAGDMNILGNNLAFSYREIYLQ